MGYLEKIECTTKGIFYNFRTDGSPIRLVTTHPQTLQIRLFTRELGDLNFGCDLEPMDVPAIFIYNDKPDEKNKAAGEIVSLDFVPKFFTLE
jgi:hypothetical protein